MRKLILPALLLSGLGAQVVIPLTLPERRVLFLVETVRLASQDSSAASRKKEEVLALVDQGLSQYLDIEDLTRAILQDNVSKFKPDQFKELVARFRRVIQLRIYREAGKSAVESSQLEVSLIKETSRPAANEAWIVFTPPGMPRPVRLGFLFDDKTRYIKDIIMEGRGLVSMYREEFQGYLTKFGPELFLKGLEKQQNDMAAQIGIAP